MVDIYSNSTLSATLALFPRPPYPLFWAPRYAGTYLLVAGLGGAL